MWDISLITHDFILLIVTSNANFIQYLKDYLDELNRIVKTEEFTEMSFRTALENLVGSIDLNYKLVQEPPRSEIFGAPDFKAFNKSVGIGYIETKNLDEDLDKHISSAQMKKYSENVGNLILTNYRRFILFRDSLNVKEIDMLHLENKGSKYKFSPNFSPDDLRDLLTAFFDYKLQKINSARDLAEHLSKKAKIIRDMAENILNYDQERIKKKEEVSPIYEFYMGIKELIHDLKIEKCADAYGQTVTYGLFLSKIRVGNSLLKRKEAATKIPRSIPVIRKIFLNISNESFPAGLSWIVDDIIDILNASDIESITEEFDKRGKTDKDPITFFYESFLGSYDKESQKHLGVYYTPRPVVNFIVNSVHMILKNTLGIDYGLANEKVTLLDPATGTGTFMWMAFLVALKELEIKNLYGIKNDTIKSHLLKHFYGLEILIAPYIFAHLKISSGLRSLGYELGDDERVQIYYSNTLDINVNEENTLIPFMKELSTESMAANSIKGNKKILIIVGNPPYNRLSSNKSDWIIKQMKDYKGNLVENERNKQPLDDDYIKFFRFAQWKIEQNGSGVLGFISNNSYVDGILHREMRYRLYETFDQIYILNLHGDKRKGEKTPEGEKDENVFDIQQGVAIGLFVKTGAQSRKYYGYYDSYGSRETKYAWLDRVNVFNINWKTLSPIGPNYYFRPISNNSSYDNFIPFSSIFKQYNTAVVPGLNEILVDFNKDALKTRMQKIFSEELGNLKAALTNSAGLKILKQRTKLNFQEDKIVPFHFHPFDFRYLYFEPKIIERARKSNTENLKNGNVGIVLSRVNVRQNYNSVIATKFYPYYKLAESSRGSYLVPLYIYDKQNCKNNGSPCINIKDAFMGLVQEKYANSNITGQEVFGYIYAVLFSNKYRSAFRNELKEGLPKIPLVNDAQSFKVLSKLGNNLLQIHCLEFDSSEEVKFNVSGGGIIDNPYFDERTEKVFINHSQCFEGISLPVWEFNIGGYQLLKKWLTERNGFVLTTEDIKHFIKMAQAIIETLKLVDKIDESLVF